jgi:hypothetical protein
MWNAFLFVGLMVIAHPPQPVKAPPTALPAQTASLATADTAATKIVAPAPTPVHDTVVPAQSDIEAP